MSIPPPGLSHAQIAEIFRRNVGAQTKLAESLGIRAAAVSLWMNEKMSSVRIEKAAQRMAVVLLRREAASQAIEIGTASAPPGQKLLTGPSKAISATGPSKAISAPNAGTPNA